MPVKTSKPPWRGRRTKARCSKEFADHTGAGGGRSRVGRRQGEESARLRDRRDLAVGGRSRWKAWYRRSLDWGWRFPKALADISERLTARCSFWLPRGTPWRWNKRNWSGCHKIDVAATALDQIVQDLRRQKQQLETEIAAQRRGVGGRIGRRGPRSARSRRRALRSSGSAKSRNTKYKKRWSARRRRTSTEKDVRLAEKKNKERQEALEKGCQQREAALKEREDELARCARGRRFPDAAFQ